MLFRNELAAWWLDRPAKFLNVDTAGVNPRIPSARGLIPPEKALGMWRVNLARQTNERAPCCLWTARGSRTTGRTRTVTGHGPPSATVVHHPLSAFDLASGR